MHGRLASPGSSPRRDVGAMYLPEEVWIEVLARLPGRDLATALCVQRSWRGNAALIWQKACEVQFPQLAGRMSPPAQVREVQYDVDMSTSSQESRVEHPAGGGGQQRAPCRRLTGWAGRYQLLALRAAELDSRALGRASRSAARMSSQNSINAFSRAILVDFLCDVSGPCCRPGPPPQPPRRG